MGVLKQGFTGIPHVTAGMGKKDAKGWILGILSREWPLAAKEIYARIRDANSNSITYQGIHKALHQLSTDEVLTRTHSKYSISPEWIDALRKFGGELYDALQGRRSAHLSEIIENASIPLVFDSLTDYFYWLLDELNTDSKNGAPDSVYCITYHPWPIIGVSRPQYLGLQEFLSSGKHYMASRGNSPLDKALSQLWRAAGANVRLGCECSKNSDLLAYRDYVIQLFIPQNTKKEMGRLFRRSARMKPDVLVQFMRSLFERSEPVNVIITRNPELSEQIKTEVLSEFK